MCSNTQEKPRGSTWSILEVNCLIDVWGSDRIQKLFAGSHRNRDVYQRVSISLGELGFGGRTWEKVRDKVNRLRVEYRKLKDKINKSGEGSITKPEWFDSLDAVLGTRPATQPSLVFDSGSNQDAIEAEAEAEAEPEVLLLQPEAEAETDADAEDGDEQANDDVGSLEGGLQDIPTPSSSIGNTEGDDTSFQDTASLDTSHTSNGNLNEDAPSTKGVKRGSKGKEKPNKKGRTAFGKARLELIDQHKEAQENSGKEHVEMMAYFESADKRLDASNDRWFSIMEKQMESERNFQQSLMQVMGNMTASMTQVMQGFAPQPFQQQFRAPRPSTEAPFHQPPFHATPGPSTQAPFHQPPFHATPGPSNQAPFHQPPFHATPGTSTQAPFHQPPFHATPGPSNQAPFHQPPFHATPRAEPSIQPPSTCTIGNEDDNYPNITQL